MGYFSSPDPRSFATEYTDPQELELQLHRQHMAELEAAGGVGALPVITEFQMPESAMPHELTRLRAASGVSTQSSDLSDSTEVRELTFILSLSLSLSQWRRGLTFSLSLFLALSLLFFYFLVTGECFLSNQRQWTPFRQCKPAGYCRQDLSETFSFFLKC